MPKKLVFGLILCFCFEGSAFATECSDNELKVVKSNSSHYKVGDCLNKKTFFSLERGQCVVLKHNNDRIQKKCGFYSDKKKIDKGIRGFIERLIRILMLKKS